MSEYRKDQAILERATRWMETGESLESDKRPWRYHPGPHEDWQMWFQYQAVN